MSILASKLYLICFTKIHLDGKYVIITLHYTMPIGSPDLKTNSSDKVRTFHLIVFITYSSVVNSRSPVPYLALPRLLFCGIFLYSLIDCLLLIITNAFFWYMTTSTLITVFGDIWIFSSIKYGLASTSN